MMDVMTTTSGLPYGRPLTRSDLETLPDDGHRYELLDGVLIVSPSPTWRHQGVAGALYALLLGALPGSDLRVFMAPLDVPIADDTVLQPDLLVVARSDLGAKWPTAAPLLAVEVLSPSTQRFDLHLKRSRYESAGTRAYWVVDPSVPSLRAWELRDGSYVEVAHVVGQEPFDATFPYPVRVVPADLVED